MGEVAGMMQCSFAGKRWCMKVAQTATDSFGTMLNATSGDVLRGSNEL